VDGLGELRDAILDPERVTSRHCKVVARISRD
jgi:hypothetical protein